MLQKIELMDVGKSEVQVAGPMLRVLKRLLGSSGRRFPVVSAE